MEHATPVTIHNQKASTVPLPRGLLSDELVGELIVEFGDTQWFYL